MLLLIKRHSIIYFSFSFGLFMPIFENSNDKSLPVGQLQHCESSEQRTIQQQLVSCCRWWEMNLPQMTDRTLEINFIPDIWSRCHETVCSNRWHWCVYKRIRNSHFFIDDGKCAKYLISCICDWIISMKANRIGLSSANFAASAMRWDRVRKRPWMETR